MRSRAKIERYEWLRVLTPFGELTPAQLRRVDQLVTPMEVPAGTQLVAEGAAARQVFVIVSGRAEVTIAGRHVATLGPGDVIGEMALLDRQPRSATVTASEPMQVLVADPRGFAALLAEPQVTRALLDVEVRRLRGADTWAPDAETA
jgi:CRP-like cAMP-binding protein